MAASNKVKQTQPELPPSVSLDGIDVTVLEQLIASTGHERQLADYRSRAEEKKGSVDPAVFARVVADYDTRLLATRTEAAPLRTRALGEYGKLRALYDTVSGRETRARLDKEECEFRHAVGEMTDDQLQEGSKGPDGVLQQCRADLSLLDEQKARFREVFSDDDLTAPLPAPSQVAPPPSAPTPQASPVLRIEPSSSPSAPESGAPEARTPVTEDDIAQAAAPIPPVPSPHATDVASGRWVTSPTAVHGANRLTDAPAGPPAARHSTANASGTGLVAAQSSSIESDATMYAPAPRSPGSHSRVAVAPLPPSDDTAAGDALSPVFEATVIAPLPPARSAAGRTPAGTTPARIPPAGISPALGGADAADEHTFVLPDGLLLVMQSDGTEAEHRLSAMNYIGRSEDNQVRVQRGGVSRKHALISAERSGFRIKDLGSQNGTFVNGKQVQQTMLSDGDLIKLGDATLRFTLPKSPYRR